eukprot:2157914-Rhodomonas_salina.1
MTKPLMTPARRPRSSTNLIVPTSVVHTVPVVYTVCNMHRVHIEHRVREAHGISGTLAAGSWVEGLGSTT